MSDLAARLAAVEARNVTFRSEHPVFWSRAAGCEVWDTGGKRYIDFTSAFGVASIGHSHPRIVAAVRDQAGVLIHGMGDVHPTELKIALMERLVRLYGGDARCILSLSGSDAVESCLKTAAMATGRPGVIAFEGGYHGLGYGALAVTHRMHFRQPFENQLGIPVTHLPFPRSPEEMTATWTLLERELDRGTNGAVIVEPIQGRGGIVVPPDGFLRGLRDRAHARGALLILDEVMTGFCRTGAWFAFEREGVRPDILAVGKSLGGGLPISAAIGSAEVMDAWPPSTGEAIHTATFLGHPLACRAALAVLDVMEEEKLADRSRATGEAIMKRLARWNPRGRGMMIGIELDSPERALSVVERCLDRGLILLPAGERGTVIEILPPLNIPSERLEEGMGILVECLENAILA